MCIYYLCRLENGASLPREGRIKCLYSYHFYYCIPAIQIKHLICKLEKQK